MKRQPIQQGRFQTTQWHVVRQATEAPDLERMEALDHLLRRYGPALVEYVKRRFHFEGDNSGEPACVASSFCSNVVMCSSDL